MGQMRHLMIFMRTMGEVEAGYVHASFQQLLQHGHAAGFWTQSAYNLQEARLRKMLEALARQ